MKIKIQAIHFNFKQQLNALLQKKLNKIQRICGDVISVDVKLTLDNAGAKFNKLCAIRLAVRGNDLQSNTQSSSFEEAIARAVEALERQIEKRKTKMKRQLIPIPVPTGNRRYYFKL